MKETHFSEGIQGDCVDMLGGEEPVEDVDEEDMVALGELEAVEDHVLVQVYHPFLPSCTSHQ